MAGLPLKPDLFEFRADRGVFEDAGTDPAEDTDPVYQWNDQGPRSLHATQATLANRPSLSSAATPNYLSFDGTDDSLPFAGSSILASTGSPFTAEFWARVTDFTGNTFQVILALKTDTADVLSIGVSSDASFTGLYFGSNSTWSRLKTDYPTASIAGSIRQFVVTYNGGGAGTAGNFAAYVDGVPQALTAAGVFGATANNNRLGSHGSGIVPLKGRLYKAAGFSRALSQSQVSARFALGTSG